MQACLQSSYFSYSVVRTPCLWPHSLYDIVKVLMSCIHLHIYCLRPLHKWYSLKCARWTGSVCEHAFFDGCELSLEVFSAERDLLHCQISCFNVEGFGLLLSFCAKVKTHIVFCFTQVNAKDLTLIMSIVLEQTALRCWLNLPVHCEIVSLTMHSRSFNLSAFWIPPTSQRWHSPSQTCPFSQKKKKKELAVTSLLSCIVIFISHIYGIRLIVIIILSGRLRSLSRRDERSGRAGDDAAARQPSYRRAFSFQRLKCVRVTTKTKRSHFHQPSPSLAFSLSPLQHAA